MSEKLPYRQKQDAEGQARDEENEDDEEEINETNYKAIKDAVLFAIEVNETMLKRPPESDSKKSDKNSPLLAALKCAYHLMQQRIISSPKDLIGILLYGTEATKSYDEAENLSGNFTYPNCYVLTDLDVPQAEDVKELKRLVESDGHDETILKSAPNAVPMYQMLFCANQMFQRSAANFSSRRLFIVSDNDDPQAENKSLRSQAAVRAKDLYDLGVLIELFPISSPDHTFDTKLFYDDIVYRSTPSDPDAIAYNPPSLTDVDTSKIKAGSTDGITLLQSLLSAIASKITPKRALIASIPLEIGPNFRISVKAYLLYKHQKPARTCYVYLGGERPQIVKGTREQVADSDAREVQKAEVRKAYAFGGELIFFSEDEAKTLKQFGDPIIRILGFKPMEKLPFWANMKNSTFLYPSEEDFVGSTRVYSALFQKLRKDKLFGLCWFIPRRNATPVMAAMIPTLSVEDKEEKRNVASVSATGAPQGLHLIPLPFADDIRSNPPSNHETPLRAPDELIDAMRPIIQQLQLPKGIYDPTKYPNPSLQWHYRILQALALDEDIPEKPEDKTKPKYKQIDKRIGNEAIEWGQVLEKTYKEHVIETREADRSGTKRAMTGTSFGAKDEDRPSKKIHTEVGETISEEEMRKLWQKGSLKSLTVVQLKDFCGVKEIPITGKKADILDRIEGWLENK